MQYTHAPSVKSPYYILYRIIKRIERRNEGTKEQELKELEEENGANRRRVSKRPLTYNQQRTLTHTQRKVREGVDPCSPPVNQHSTRSARHSLAQQFQFTYLKKHEFFPSLAKDLSFAMATAQKPNMTFLDTRTRDTFIRAVESKSRFLDILVPLHLPRAITSYFYCTYCHTF